MLKYQHSRGLADDVTHGRHTMNRPHPLGLLAVAGILTLFACAMPLADETSSSDIRDLIGAARGAPAILCEFAARAIYGGWGWGDAPATPLGAPGRWRREQSVRTPEDVRFLLESLDTPDPCVRELAVRLVARVDRPEVGAGLIDRLDARDSSLRVVAALGLGIRAEKRAVEPLIRATRDDAPAVRANAVWALGRIGDPRGAPAAEDRLDDRSSLVRESAAGTLGHLEAKASLPALIRVLRSDPAAGVRRVSAWAVVELGEGDGAGDLAKALRDDPSPAVREMCAWGLGNVRGESVAGPLAAAARSDGDADVREAAVWAMGERGERESAAMLGEIVEHDRSDEVRRTAAWALGQIGADQAPKGLIAALRDEDAELRLTAAWALSEIGDRAALPALRAAVSREENDRARKAEIRALIHSGERAEQMSDLLKSDDEDVRRAAIQAVTGRHGVDPWPWPQPRPRPFP
jgi:HEAT repeat protein